MKTFITSMNAKLFKQYGKQFLEGWAQQAGPDIELIVCFEGDLAEIPAAQRQSDRYRMIPIESETQKFFLRKFSTRWEICGNEAVLLDAANGTYQFRYNFRFDAVRFSFKIFSFVKCLQLGLIKNDFAWIDSDIVCLRPFSASDMQAFFPEGEELVSYLGRMTYPGPNAYSECGFVGYNYSHPQWKKFIESMLDMYMSGNFLLLPEWHDCMVFDYCRNRFENVKKIRFKNLVAHLPESPDPFEISRLSLYFEHLKGPIRKAQLERSALHSGEALAIPA